MTSRDLMILAGLAVGAVGTSVANAADKPWSVALYAGDSISGSGTLHSPRSANIANLGTLDPKLAGASGTLSLDKLRYHELYHNRFSTGLELGYSFTDNIMAFGRFTYDARQGRARDVGHLTSGALSAPQIATLHVGNSDSRGLEVGARYFWLAKEMWRPFVSLSLGATHTDEARGTLTVRNTAIDIHDVLFADSGTTFSQTLETGVEFAPSEQFQLRFSVRANHVGTQHSGNDPRLASLGFQAGDDASSRTDYPVALVGVYRF
jgi:opacity protein-like surface antigen